MTSPIVGDEAPKGSTLRANGAHDVAGSEQTLAAPISALEQEGGDARADNKLSDQAADAKVAQNGSLKSSSATAGAAEANHAGSPSGDPSRGLADAIAADQHHSTLEATSEGPTTREGSPSYPVAIQPAQQLGLQIPPTSSALPLQINGANASGSRPESNITPDTEVQDGADDSGHQMEVDMKPPPPPAPKKDLPAFIQTSALITNSCGYCGTRSTSGCWRRGWEIGDGKFINLCNKCGLRHKAGKLHSVPQPAPSPNRRGAAAAAARGVSRSTPSAAATPTAASLTAAEREAAAANAAAAVAAAAGLPGTAAGDLLRNYMLEQQQQQRGGGSSSSLGSLLAVAAANAAAAAAGDNAGGSSEAGMQRDYVNPTKQKIAALLEGLGLKTEIGNSINQSNNPDNITSRSRGNLLLRSSSGGSGRNDVIPRKLSSNVTPYDSYTPAAAAAAGGSSRRSSQMEGLPDFAAAANGSSDRSNLPASAVISAFLAAAEAAAGGSSGSSSDLGFDLSLISNHMSPEFMQYLANTANGEEPPAKRRRTKKIPGGFPVAAPAARARPAAAAAALDPDESLAVGAADALLTLNRSSPSGSPRTGSPATLDPTAAAAAAATDPFITPIPYDQAAAAAAADKAAAAAERAAAAAATAAVDAAAGIAGWSPGPSKRNMLEAFLSGALMQQRYKTGPAAAAAGSSGRGSSRGGSEHGGAAAVATTPSRQPSRQVTTSPNALRPGTHSLFPPQTPNSHNPSPRNLTSPSNLAGNGGNFAGSGGNPAGNISNLAGSLTSVRSWLPERIYQWLHATGCSEAVRVFRDLEIEGLALAGLVRVAAADPARLHDVLKADLGVQQVGLRLRLVEGLGALAMGEGL